MRVVVDVMLDAETKTINFHYLGSKLFVVNSHVRLLQRHHASETPHPINDWFVVPQILDERSLVASGINWIYYCTVIVWEDEVDLLAGIVGDECHRFGRWRNTGAAEAAHFSVL